MAKLGWRTPGCNIADLDCHINALPDGPVNPPKAALPQQGPQSHIIKGSVVSKLHGWGQAGHQRRSYSRAPAVVRQQVCGLSHAEVLGAQEAGAHTHGGRSSASIHWCISAVLQGRGQQPANLWLQKPTGSSAHSNAAFGPLKNATICQRGVVQSGQWQSKHIPAV